MAIDRNKLSDALVAAVSSVISLAQENGIGINLPVRQYQVHWMEPTGPGSSGGHTETREEPSYYVLREHLGVSLYDLPEVQALSQMADDFLEDEGKFFMAFPGRRSERELVDQLLSIYFGRVDGTLALNQTLVASLIEQFVDEHTSAEANIVSLYWLQNFEASDEFQLDDGDTFRRMNRESIDRFGRIPQSLSFGGPPWLNVNDWICEIKRPSPKDTTEVWNNQGEVIQDVCLAMGLTKEGIARFTLLE